MRPKLPRRRPRRFRSFSYSSSDPVEAGLVDSLARPGGNLTGFSNFRTLLTGKRLELLKETIPKLSRVAVLWNPQNSGIRHNGKKANSRRRALGLQLHSMEVSSADKFENAFKEAIKARSAALTVTTSPFLNSNLPRTVELAAKHRLPAIYVSRRFCRERRLDVLWNRSNGTLQTRRSDGRQDFEGYQARRHSSRAADQVRVRRSISKRPKQIGLTIPPNVLVRADRVIR